MDPLIALCAVTARRRDRSPEDLVEKVEPLLGNPALREIATLLLTNIGFGSNNKDREDGEKADSCEDPKQRERAAEIRSQISDLHDKLSASSRALDATTADYKDIHGRLVQSNSLSVRRQLLDAIDSIVGCIGDAVNANPVQSLKDIAAEISQRANDLNKLRHGSAHVNDSGGNQHRERSDESRQVMLLEYYDQISATHKDLETEREATQEINTFIESTFPNDPFIKENILRRMECQLGLAEVDIIKKRIAEMEVW
jgi:uncharacterized protein YdhG (YjbR/CyaY superfamily)